jgi:hypothetical protein
MVVVWVCTWLVVFSSVCVCVWFLGVVVCEWRSVFMVVGLLCVVEHGFFKK